MRLYLAGASKQRAFIANLAGAIERQGHTITHKWWANFCTRWTLGRSFSQSAKDDLAGVADCEVLVIVMDDRTVSPGAHLELGYALALRKPVLAILTNWDKQLHESIWLHLESIRLCQMDEDLDVKLGGLNYQLQLAVLAVETADATA